MKYSSAQLGRVLVIRLEDGDVVHECIERAARTEGIARAAVILRRAAEMAQPLIAQRRHELIVEPPARPVLWWGDADRLVRTLDAITDDLDTISTAAIVQVIDVIDDSILLVKKQGN